MATVWFHSWMLLAEKEQTGHCISRFLAEIWSFWWTTSEWVLISAKWKCSRNFVICKARARSDLLPKSPTTDSHGWHETHPELQQFLCSWASNFTLLSFCGLAFTATSIVTTTSTTTCQTRRWDKYPKAAFGFEAWQPLWLLWFVRNGRDRELNSEKIMAATNISERQKRESHRNPKLQEKATCYSTNS